MVGILNVLRSLFPTSPLLIFSVYERKIGTSSPEPAIRHQQCKDSFLRWALENKRDGLSQCIPMDCTEPPFHLNCLVGSMSFLKRVHFQENSTAGNLTLLVTSSDEDGELDLAAQRLTLRWSLGGLEYLQEKAIWKLEPTSSETGTKGVNWMRDTYVFLHSAATKTRHAAVASGIADIEPGHNGNIFLVMPPAFPKLSFFSGPGWEGVPSSAVNPVDGDFEETSDDHKSAYDIITALHLSSQAKDEPTSTRVPSGTSAVISGSLVGGGNFCSGSGLCAFSVLEYTCAAQGGNVWCIHDPAVTDDGVISTEAFRALIPWTESAALTSPASTLADRHTYALTVAAASVGASPAGSIAIFAALVFRRRRPNWRRGHGRE